MHNYTCLEQLNLRDPFPQQRQSDTSAGYTGILKKKKIHGGMGPRLKKLLGQTIHFFQHCEITKYLYTTGQL